MNVSLRIRAVKQRLRETYRCLDPVLLLAEIRAAQDELGERIGKRGLAAAAGASPADPLAFARSLGTPALAGEVRATHRVRRRRYKTRIRMPSKLDPHLTTIESWVLAEPQLTALAIVRRLAAIDPTNFSAKQHSIVQRLLRSLRRNAAGTVMAIAPQQAPTLRGRRFVLWASAPSTGPPAERASIRDGVIGHITP